MNHRVVLFTVIAVAACSTVNAQTTKFDGPWKVTMTCPAHHSAAGDDAKGYTHYFPGEVVNSELSATHGTAGEPGWHFLRGKIAPDGSATLRLDGVVNSPQHAINDAPRGKEYTYRVKAQFSESSGSGQRLTGRVCEFAFVR